MTAKVMKILSGPELRLTHISPWNHGDPPKSQRSLNINHPNRFRGQLVRRSRTWRIRAEAKGFNRAPPRIPLQKKETENDDAARKKDAGDQNKNNYDEEMIPDVVQNRVISRILLYVGVPLAAGLVLLKVFGAVKEQNLWDVPYWLPIFTTFITFGASTLGIAYGALSTSWDPDREGSFLGFEEAEKNWVDMWREEDDD